MTWTKKTISAPLPPEAQALIDQLNAVLTPLATILSTVSTLLNAASVLFSAGTDLYNALFNALVTAVEDLVNDLFGSGAFELIVDPFNIIGRRIVKDQFGIAQITPDEAIQLAIKSFDDLADDNRPQFSEGAQVAAFGLMFTVTDISALLAMIEALAALWNIPQLKYIEKAIKKKKNKRPKRSTGADWDSLRFNQIQALGDVQKQLINLLEIARGYGVIPDSNIADLILSLSRKAQVLADTVTTFQAIIDAILAIPSISGVYVFDLPLGAGGNKRIKDALPDPLLESLGLNKYTIFLLYVGGGPSAAGVDRIRALIT